MRTIITFLAFIAVCFSINAQTAEWNLGDHNFSIVTLRGKQLLMSTSQTTGKTQVLNLEPGVVIKDLKMVSEDRRLLEICLVEQKGEANTPIFFYLGEGGWERLQTRRVWKSEQDRVAVPICGGYFPQVSYPAPTPVYVRP